MSRRLRAAFTLGFMWAIAWFPIGVLVALYAAATPPKPGDLLWRPIEFPTFLSVWTIWGGLSGTGFALILGATERGRMLGELSLARTALWGALGAMSAPSVLTAIDMWRGLAFSPLYDWLVPLTGVLASAVLGGACAAATLIVARRPEGPRSRITRR